ncbi:PQQ-dependent sugar dehydrogenase [Pontibacter litorisediminis]|uniref:PQQ-dependent sugar dehydrogenase n=1 Tax=Pontibacter litorisediminis TaxID=1846260 RepID=UPI0023EC9C32|nr:PQQ-dependent sugar dehydrogenase [Pontibacter litorisediminis]
MKRQTYKVRKFLLGRFLSGRKHNKGRKGLLSILTVALLFCAGIAQQSCDPDEPFLLPRSVDLELLADGMVSPIGVVPAPDDSKMLFVIDQIGKVWVLDKYGNKLAQPFLDVSSKIVDLNEAYDERGLLGLAFHPNYASNGRFFVYYTAPPRGGGPTPDASWNNISRISEFMVSSDPTKADMGSERVILEVDQPQSNHEGGTLAFGPDGYLYISIGDGGGANDVGPGHVEDWYEVNEGGNGQDVEENLLGNILRIDVNSGSPYGIPSDNPFAGADDPRLDEIYAYGFRNPYRFSFDMSGSRKLYAGDAGQNLWEEISIVEKGGNYGWNVKEGTHCFDASDPLNVLSSCPDTDVYGNKLIDPVIEAKNYSNPNGGHFLVIVGGYVYRGNDIPGLQGKYIFGNFSAEDEEAEGEIYMACPAGQGLWNYEMVELESFPEGLEQYVKGFGQDLYGEMYVTTSEILGPSGNTGKVYKMVSKVKGFSEE